MDPMRTMQQVTTRWRDCRRVRSTSVLSRMMMMNRDIFRWVRSTSVLSRMMMMNRDIFRWVRSTLASLGRRRMKKDMCERIREIDTILEDANLKSCFVIIAIIGVTFHRLRNMTYY